jgi:hypothetical protein
MYSTLTLRMPSPTPGHATSSKITSNPLPYKYVHIPYGTVENSIGSNPPVLAVVALTFFLYHSPAQATEMPPKEISNANELAEQLAAMRTELERTQRELDRASHHSREERLEGMDAFIATVSKVDIPSFWEADPVLWFRQCESAFRRANTTSSGVKFDHRVGKLPNSVSLSCRSLRLSINFEDKDAYERLKAHLCKNFGKSKWQMGYALLDSPGLGDPRPTQLLQDLRALLPTGETESTLFQCIFLKRLPVAMSDAILAANLEDIEAMAKMADRLFDRPSTAAIAAAIQPCCTHVSAIDSQQRKFNRSGQSQEHSAQSPVRRASTSG